MRTYITKNQTNSELNPILIKGRSVKFECSVRNVIIAHSVRK